MIRKKTNKKALGLLVLLVAFSLLASKIFSSSNITSNISKEHSSKPEQCQNCGTGNTNNSSVIEEQVVSEDINENTIYVGTSGTIDITGNIKEREIKGASISCDGIPSDTLLSSLRKTCSNGAGPVDYTDGGSPSSGGSGITVTKDSDIKIIKITYPLALFLGQATYQDSNKQIRKDSPEYRSNGQQIDVEYVSRNLSPKESEEFTESLESTEKQPFDVEATVNVGQNDGIKDSDSGRYEVKNADHNPGCTVNGKTCDRKLAISDFNVEKSNKLASHSKYGGYLMGQAPVKDLETKAEKEQLRIGEQKKCLAEDENYTLWDDGVVTACNNVVGMITATFKRMFGLDQWNRCTVGETVVDEDGNVTQLPPVNDCIDPKTIGIEMTPIFGEPYKCTDELCANAMLVDKYRSVLSPKEAEGLQENSINPNKSVTKFVATDCDITIDGKLVKVLCLWDASPYALNYQLQAKDSAPKQEDFPDNFNSYWKSVKKSSDMSAERYAL